MSALSGFWVFDFNEGFPYASITRNGITFNKGVVLKLGSPAYVLLLVNPATQQIALQSCDKDTPRSVPFLKEDRKRRDVLSVRWNGKDLLNTISEITNWDLGKDAYRVDGKMLPEEHAMIFNLTDAVLLGETSNK